MSDIFGDLVFHLKATTDRRSKEYHFTCVVCGHASSPRSPHCSMNREKGWFCFSCGSNGSLYDLANRLDIAQMVTESPVRPQEAQGATQPPRPISPELVNTLVAAAGLVEAWQEYKPLSEETIKIHRLGLGILPHSRCSHPRLIVPIFDHNQCVSLRGRRLGCACEAKWLSTAGSTLGRLPLYNSPIPQGSVVMIVENCADALLVSQETDYHGVAIYSTSYWRDAWMQTLAEADPEMVVVALDNDLVGNGGAARQAEFADAWLKTHPVVPESRGIRLTNLLLAAGLPAMLWDWGSKPYKYDMGSLIMEEKHGRLG